MNKNNKLTIMLIIAILSTTTVSVAGWKDLKNSVKNKVSNKLESKPDNKKTPNKVKQQSSKVKTNPELRNNILKCMDLKPANIQKGYVESYKVTEGLSSSNYSGLIKREKVQVTNGCFVGELDPLQCVVMTVDEKKFNALGSSNDWELQCVYSDDPSTAAHEAPKNPNGVSGKEMLLKCGHDQGGNYPCHDGSNSQRSGEYIHKIIKGKKMLSFCAVSSHDRDFADQYVYCQYYNKKAKKSLFALEFHQLKD
jgi:hypothetical protein